MSKDDKVCVQLAFTRAISPSVREKIREFWRFLDAEKVLHPYNPGIERIRRRSRSPETKDPETQNKVSGDERIWYHGLKLLRELELDKVALAAMREACRLCNQTKLSRTNYADTVTQPYEELNREMKDFERRVKARAKEESD